MNWKQKASNKKLKHEGSMGQKWSKYRGKIDGPAAVGTSSRNEHSRGQKVIRWFPSCIAISKQDVSARQICKSLSTALSSSLYFWEIELPVPVPVCIIWSKYWFEACRALFFTIVFQQVTVASLRCDSCEHTGICWAYLPTHAGLCRRD